MLFESLCPGLQVHRLGFRRSLSAMQRRDLLAVGVSGVAAAVGGQLLACADKHKHAEKPTPTTRGEAIASRHAPLVAAVRDCISAGENCQQLCIEQLAAGDQMMADCNGAVHEMLAVCRAVPALATANSKHLAALVSVCAKVCADCQAACEKHAAHHAECAACATACAATIKQAASYT
jgi:Cys-rich four helix bundle protein (predicted Tat secretion target)